MVDVGVVGASGYGGGELLRLLNAHPTLKVTAVGAGDSAGRALEDVFPHLAMSGRLLPAEPDAFEGCAVVFLATPAEVSERLAWSLAEQGALVVDLSDAFRLRAAPLHDQAENGVVYGLPELFRDRLPGARVIANPGCYPTAALLALAPLAGLVDTASVVVTGMSGVSGAGRRLRDDLHAAHAMQNVAPYGAPGHRHTPEIAAGWHACATSAGGGPVADGGAVTFVPHLAPMPRGLLCTVTAASLEAPDDQDQHGAYVERYGSEAFVRVLAPGRWPHTTHVVGGNGAHIGVAADADSGRVIASCAIDNLGKGAAGQAVQNANIALGLPEDAGLTPTGVYP